jgi:hypothetical protein
LTKEDTEEVYAYIDDLDQRLTRIMSAYTTLPAADVVDLGLSA